MPLPVKTFNLTGLAIQLGRKLIAVRSRSFTGLVTGLFLISTAGCQWTDAKGTHRLIVGVGFGVITTTNRPGVEVFDSRVLGLELGPEIVGTGYLSRHRVTIDPALASNVVVSVNANPFGLTVTNYDLSATNWPSDPTEKTTNPQ